MQLVHACRWGVHGTSTIFIYYGTCAWCGVEHSTIIHYLAMQLVQMGGGTQIYNILLCKWRQTCANEGEIQYKCSFAMQNYYGRCEPPKFGCTSYLSGPKETLNIWEWKCPLCYTYHCPPIFTGWRAGRPYKVSSNTIIACLSHNTPKSMLGQKLDF